MGSIKPDGKALAYAVAAVVAYHLLQKRRGA